MSRQASTLKTSDRRCTLPQVLVLLLCTVCGCATPEREQIRLEAYSWWTRPSEQNAFESVLRIYNEAHEDALAVNQFTGDRTADEVRATLTARLLADAPPSTFQANAGADLLRWTAMDTADGVDNASRIAPLTALFRRTGFDTVLPNEVSEALRAGLEREPYGVPLNIHRLNLVYYNTDSFRKYREKYGKSFLDPEVLCPTNVADLLGNSRNKLDLQIAVGTRDGFSLTLFALENLLPAVVGSAEYKAGTGRTFYDELFLGNLEEKEWREPLLRALRCMQYLSRSFIREDDVSWADALNRVVLGDAAFIVMGDWANGELKQALLDRKVDSTPFPGSEGTFVFTSDTFPLPTKAPHARESEELLETLTSKQAQLAFSKEKGSIPARSDISVEDVELELGQRAADTRKDFYADGIHKSIATSGLFPPYYPELTSRLTAMTAIGASDASIQDVIAFMRNTLPLLARWQNRISSDQQTQ